MKKRRTIKGENSTVEQKQVGCKVKRKRRWYKKKRILIPCFSVVALSVYLTFDYYGPSEISVQRYQVWGFSCLRAKGLVVHSQGPNGHLWATRGMWAYRWKKGDTKFVRQYHIPTGVSSHWLRNFSVVRKITRRAVCVEMLPLAGGGCCAMSAGHMWFRAGEGESFIKTFTLPHYGVGVGSGLRVSGLAQVQDGTLYIGEYFRNRKKTNVRVYASNDEGRTWQVAHDFRAGEIRHIHSIQQDRYTEKVWVCTGDTDSESMITWTTDQAETLHVIGRGSQKWRVGRLVFFQNRIYWGSDTGEKLHAGIYRWDRRTGETTRLCYVPGAILYSTALAKGTIVMSTDREDGENEEDDNAHLWIIFGDEDVASITCDSRLHGAQAFLRFARDQGGSNLCLTCLNLDAKHNNDLLVIPEAELLRVARERASSEADNKD